MNRAKELILGCRKASKREDVRNICTPGNSVDKPRYNQRRKGEP
jgi:hypothetical protein